MTITYEYGDCLYINMTNRCCNRCEFCLRGNSSGSLYAENLWYEGTEPTQEQILENLKTRDLKKYRDIVFCGYGEPACRWDEMLWLCDRIRELGNYQIRVNTNGQSDLICGRDTAPETKGRFDTVSVSLNANSPEKYDALCHSDFGEKAYAALLKFTKSCVLYVPQVVMTVVDTMPQGEIEDCRKICEDLGAKFRIRSYIKE